MCSEPRLLRWGDINWEHPARFTVRSPKTERYGKGERVVPIFPELAPLFQQRFEEAAEGDEYVLPMLRSITDSGAYNRLEKAVRRADVRRWPRLWHNLRATRQTELENEYGLKTACDWLGNSKTTAMASYLQTPQSHFEKAVRNPAQQAPESARNAL